MRIWNMPRGSGKTTRMLYASEYTGKNILVTTKKRAERLESQAKQLGLRIPKVLSVEELSDKSKSVSKDILVDDALDVLQEFICQARGNTEATDVTVSYPMMESPKEDHKTDNSTMMNSSDSLSKETWKVQLSDYQNYLLQEGSIVKSTEDLMDADLKTQLVHPGATIPAGTELKVVDVWTNFYGRWVRVIYNGRYYDLDPKKLEYIRRG